MQKLAAWSVYIARCADGSLYTGIAKDVRARLEAHNSGRGAAYTRPRRPVRLVLREDGFSRGKALSREAKIKSLARPAKLALVKAAARALAAALLLLAAGTARATPVFDPEGIDLFPTTSMQSFAQSTPGVPCYPSQTGNCYPLRAYYIPLGVVLGFPFVDLCTSGPCGTAVNSATSVDGLSWIADATAGALTTATTPLIVNASSITAAVVLPRTLSAGFEMFYTAISTPVGPAVYGIYTATSADGINWANATVGAAPVPSAAPVIQLSGGAAFVGSPRVIVTAGNGWLMYFTGNNDGGTDLAGRRIFRSQSLDSGVTWSVPAVIAASTVAYEVGASQLTDGRIRLYYTEPPPTQSSATIVASLITADPSGIFFTEENAPIVSTPPATGSLSFPVPVRSTDTFRWRLYYDVASLNVEGSVYSALTGPPAPTGVNPSSMYNTISTAAITANGEIFSPGATFFLSMAGQPNIVPFGVVRVNDEQLTGNIDVLDAALGLWDLIVINADGSTTDIANSFLITFPPGSVNLTDNLISPRSGTTKTKIAISFFNDGPVLAKIFTIDGRHVTTLLDAVEPKGVLNLTWNGTNAGGASVPSGLYVLRVTAPKTEVLSKIVVIR